MDGNSFLGGGHMDCFLNCNTSLIISSDIAKANDRLLSRCASHSYAANTKNWWHGGCFCLYIFVSSLAIKC
jgi:hypothetical protein